MVSGQSMVQGAKWHEPFTIGHNYTIYCTKEKKKGKWKKEGRKGIKRKKEWDKKKEGRG